MRIYFLLVAVLTAGYVAQGQSSGENGGSKVGYANVEYIISQLPDMKQIESEMKSTQTQLRNQIQAKSEAVQKQYKDFTAGMQTMHDTVRTNRQRELEQSIADLEKMQEDAQRTLENKQKLFMAPVVLKVNKVIQEVAQENGYDMILTDKVSGFNVLLARSGQMDISNLVLKKFGVTAPAK